MTRIVSVKFRTAGKLYDFDARDLELNEGDQVVVETDRGRALGQVVTAPREVEGADAPANLKNVLRPATAEDLKMAEVNAGREEEAYRFCLKRIQERRMEMKLVRAEYLFDGSKIIFYFTADGRVDFRELVKDLAHYFHTRIEMRQIGVRDEAKLTGGLGICGRELCCCTFLREFDPVSVKMAKEQGLALNPNKISGQCGRLLCCLNYEFETYCQMRKGLPKCGKRVCVGNEEGDVISQHVLAQTLTVRLKDRTVEVPAEQVKPAKPLPSRAGEGTPQTERPREGGGERPRRGGRRRTEPTERRGAPAADSKPAEEKKSADQEEQKQARKKSRRRRRPPRKRKPQGPGDDGNN